MTLSQTVHLLVPDGFDDPTQPSGGNHYDLRIQDGLAEIGWRVHTWRVPGCWPRPDVRAGSAVAAVTADIPDDSVVLVDGIIASALPEVFVPAARRLRLVVLMHMPLAEMAGHLRDATFRAQEVLSAAAATITTSRWTRDRLLAEHNLSADRVHVAHPGSDAVELAPSRENGRALLCVATIAAHKGHDTLVSALDRIAELPWHCTFAGPLDREPRFVDNLRRQLDNSRVADRVTFVGTLAGDSLSKQYAAADLVVLASRVESYGMVLGEALARGIPVVATRVGGIPEAVGTANDGTVPGLLVAPNDAEALSEELARWLQDPQLRHRLRAAARDRRRSLPTWRSSTERVAAVLAGVAG
ncbi:glycosyltransferase family 4 protein [Smaragdicoccus niigatensis]|uniref:glycosyltransferase family 4 protein n=1 Tax=Smaragdicoccus niigatensis TaxID=359359 RepID=UPI00037A14BC|nr:glycosyltransferase family 4 protein [Smaragdicoccus niigatensis]